MNNFGWIFTVLFFFFAISSLAQIECVPLQGSALRSIKGKPKIGFDGRMYSPTTEGIIAYNGTKIDHLKIGSEKGELAKNAIRQIHFSSDSVVWITYQDGGYSTITKDTIIHNINAGGPSDYLCFDVIEHQDMLYMGTKNGFYPHQNGEFLDPINIGLIDKESYDLKKTFNDIRNAKVSIENPDKLWLFGIGLYSYDVNTKELIFYKMPKKFLEDFQSLEIGNDSYLYMDLLETESVIYLTTWGGGILEFSKLDFTWKKHLLRPYRDGEPLNENVFFEMAFYEDNSFLLGSRSGLLKFDMVSKKLTPHLFEGKEDIFNQGSVRISEIADQIIFSKYRSICMLQNPDTTNYKSLNDSLIISDVKLDGVSQNVNNYFFKEFRNEFKNYQRNINFEYEFAAPFNKQKRSYAYKLEGLNDKWVFQNEDEAVNFSNLKGGKYSFQVRNQLEDGSYVYSNTFAFSIDRYYYENWWFWIAAGLAIFGILGTFILLKWNQKKKELALQEKHNKELAQLEMSALRAQMNPHFLFNSLNSIKNFALTKGPKETSSYLTKFSHLIRLILQNSKSPMVNLKDELEALKLYIEIESLRFANKFKFMFNVDEGLMMASIQIPPLILQPYVENSIWHGLMHKRDGEGILSISIKDLGDSIQCMIEDNGIGREMAKKIKNEKIYSNQKSMGMDITSDRIELTNKIYKINTRVNVIDLYDKNGNACGTRVLIDIPKIETTFK